MSDKKETIAFDFGNSTECRATNVIGLGFDKGVYFNQSHKSEVSHALFLGGEQQKIVDIDTAVRSILIEIDKSIIIQEKKVQLRLRSDDVLEAILDKSKTTYADKLASCISPLQKLQSTLEAITQTGTKFSNCIATIKTILAGLGIQ